jgi:hypothetical protein
LPKRPQQRIQEIGTPPDERVNGVEEFKEFELLVNQRKQILYRWAP